MSRGTYNTMATRTPNDVLALVGRIESAYKKNELHLLLFLIDMAQNNYGTVISKTKLLEPKTD